MSKKESRAKSAPSRATRAAKPSASKRAVAAKAVAKKEPAKPLVAPGEVAFRDGTAPQDAALRQRILEGAAAVLEFARSQVDRGAYLDDIDGGDREIKVHFSAGIPAQKVFDSFRAAGSPCSPPCGVRHTCFGLRAVLGYYVILFPATRVSVC